MTFIWSTRGKTWGFRFLRDGGVLDPLVEYTQAFSGIENEREIWRRTDKVVAVRFADPQQRQDSAGRIISQEFVLFGDLASLVNSVEDGRATMWRMVAEQFDQIWDQADAPPISH